MSNTLVPNIPTAPWLKVAASHLGLKEIKGPQHNKTIIMWLEKLNAWWRDDETPWCFTSEVELLTEDGWVRFDAYDESRRVYQVNELGQMSLTPVIKRIEKDYDSDAFRIMTRSIDITCDTGHRWWGYWGHGSDKKFNTLDKMDYNGLFIESTTDKKGSCGLTEEELFLLAAFICDGKVRYSKSTKLENKDKPISIEFEVSRERKINKLTSLGPDHVYTQSKVYGPLTRTPLTVFSFKYPDYFNSCMDGYKRLSRDFINSLGRDDARIFLNAYNTFDGNGVMKNSSILYSSDRKMIDDLIEICVIAGYHPSMRLRTDGSNLTKKQAFTINYRKEKKYRHISPKHVERVSYTGKMYCVQVPEGRIIVRGRNSAPLVTGNCGVFTAACMHECGLPFPKLYMRALAWNDYGVKLLKPVPGCIVTFTRQGGGHVGFVVGESTDGKLLVLGGNQSDMVSIAKFDYSRVTSYRWPAGIPVPEVQLAKHSVTGSVSTNEA